jgi:hypothetical protein
VARLEGLAERLLEHLAAVVSATKVGHRLHPFVRLPTLSSYWMRRHRTELSLGG